MASIISGHRIYSPRNTEWVRVAFSVGMLGATGIRTHPPTHTGSGVDMKSTHSEDGAHCAMVACWSVLYVLRGHPCLIIPVCRGQKWAGPGAGAAKERLHLVGKYGMSTRNCPAFVKPTAADSTAYRPKIGQSLRILVVSYVTAVGFTSVRQLRVQYDPCSIQ